MGQSLVKWSFNRCFHVIVKGYNRDRDASVSIVFSYGTEYVVLHFPVKSLMLHINILV